MSICDGFWVVVCTCVQKSTWVFFARNGFQGAFGVLNFPRALETEEHCYFNPFGGFVTKWCRQNGRKQPVLKHGPRSLSIARVFECWKLECVMKVNRWEPFLLIRGGTIGRSWSSVKDLSPSTDVGTRKMVNYAWGGRSLGKPRWRSAGILTCKSIFKFRYRGERLIEPSSSWFPPKFPLG